MKKARTRQFIIRVNDNEWKTIKENAEKAQLSVSEYLRTMGIYKEIK